MTKENYMALADFQSLWTNTIKPYIVAGFIAVTTVAEGATPQLVLQDGSLIAQSTFIPATEKAANNGIATLDATGKVPASQLPSFVDDVLEFASQAAFPATGEGGKIYIALDTNKTYRWGGTTYVEISAGLALGETQGTAYEGSKGKALKDAFDAHEADTDIHVTTSDKTAWSAKYDKPGTGIPSTDMTAEVQASLGKADSAIQSVKVNGVALTPDSNKAVDVEVPERVTTAELATFVV